ncbi:MAG: hypothetical protein H8E34_07055 [Bacteroidetes bacterium]|nr:hypothetical protein [Bacteroidota bacterium]MBL6944605.1 hypothetical protein [Bacteroidales bacterium]
MKFVLRLPNHGRKPEVRSQKLLLKLQTPDFRLETMKFKETESLALKVHTNLPAKAGF